MNGLSNRKAVDAGRGGRGWEGREGLWGYYTDSSKGIATLCIRSY